MTLPADIARCPGYVAGHRFPDEECVTCARRIEGVRDYIGGHRVAWMDPPQERPCPARLEQKK